MNLTNKKIIIIYLLSPFLGGMFATLFEMFSGNSSLASQVSPLIIKINVPFVGYLIDSLQMISMVSGAGYAYSTIVFLLFFIIPSRLIVKLTFKENFISRLIKCIVIAICLKKFSIEGNTVFNSSIFLTIAIYAFVFCLIPKKITGISDKQNHIDQFIHITLSEIIGYNLLSLWTSLFPVNTQSDIALIFGITYLMAFFAVMFFCIPAILTGIVKIYVNHLNQFKQIVICGLAGGVFSYLTMFLVTNGSYRSDINGGVSSFLPYSMGCIGCITAMLVTIIVNLINTQPVKQPEEINHQ